MSKIKLKPIKCKNCGYTETPSPLNVDKCGLVRCAICGKSNLVEYDFVKDMPEGSYCFWHVDNVVYGNKTMKCKSCKIYKDMPEGSYCVWHMDNVVYGNKTTEECTEYIPCDKKKKRFVVNFHHPYYNEPSYEDQINTYAETNGLIIVQIAPLYGNGIFVLFEKGGGE